MIDKAGYGLEGQVRAQVHAHLSEFKADVGVEPGLGKRIEDPVITLGRLVGPIGSGDVFAEAVEGDSNALGAQDGGGAEGVLDTKAGDKAGRQAAAEGGRLGETAQVGVLREPDEC